MAAFDFKKEYRDLYLPKNEPCIVEIPPMQYVAVEGRGDPNEAGGEYSDALGVLYALSYTIKMSYKGDREIPGYFAYVVPPLEGFWWMSDGSPGVNYADKSGFCWVSLIRLPQFVDKDVFSWAKTAAEKKKKIDMSRAKLLTVEEGLCVQCMHLGSYDDEPATCAKMDRYLEENGYRNDFSASRRHHEIYLGDPRKTAPDKLKTVIRHPVALK